MPTATELACYLADLTEFPMADESCGRQPGPCGKLPDLTKVAQYAEMVLGRGELHRELHTIFARDYPLAPLHEFLAALPGPLLIVTTNYDDLIERALAAKGRTFDVVIHTTDSRRGEQLLWWEHGATHPREVTSNKLYLELEEVTVVYKMHGSVDRRDASRDQYVITENDYIDFLARMTRGKAIPAIFSEPFERRAFLFLGYGLRDWNLRVVMKHVERDVRQAGNIKSWAVQHRPSVLETRFWQQRSVEVFRLTIDELVTRLTTAEATA